MPLCHTSLRYHADTHDALVCPQLRTELFDSLSSEGTVQLIAMETPCLRKQCPTLQQVSTKRVIKLQ